VRAPVDPNRASFGEPAGLDVLLARPARRLVREDLQPQQAGIGRELELGRLSRCVASLREARIDALDTHNRCVLPSTRAGAAVDAPADLETQHIGARLCAWRRAPGESAGPGGKAARSLPDDRGPALAGAHHVGCDDLQPHRRRTLKPEVDDRLIAKAVTVRAYRGQQTAVAEVGRRTVCHAEVEQRRFRCRQHCRRSQDQCGHHRLTISLPSNDAGHN